MPPPSPQNAPEGLLRDLLDLRARLIQREAALDARVASMLSRLYDQWDAELRSILGGGAFSKEVKDIIARRAAILQGLRRITAAEAARIKAVVGAEAEAVYRSEIYRVASGIAHNAPASISTSGVSFSKVDIPAVRTSLAMTDLPGRSEMKSLANIPARVESLMRADLASAVADGYLLSDLVSKWKARAGAGRVVGEIRSLARTSMMAASNAAHLDTYRKNSDLIDGVRYEATFDRRTCLRCSSLHGREYPVDDAPPVPQHQLCRCILLPVLIDKRLGYETYNVAAYQTPTGGTYFRNADRSFEKFLRNETPDFRADFFPSNLKREAFESRKLSLPDMINRDGSIKTDDQIRRLLKTP